MQLKSCLDQDGLLNVYYSLAYSHIANNVVCWGVSTDIGRVLVCQKRILRLIFNLEPRESCKDIFKKNKVLTVPSIFILKCVTYVKSNFSSFIKANENHNYSTRHGDMLQIPRHKNTFYKDSPHYNMIIMYNNLPTYLKQIHPYNSFKTQVKEFLVRSAFYNISDFLK